MYGRFIVQLMYATPHLFPVDMSIIHIYPGQSNSTILPATRVENKKQKTRFPKNINFSVASSLLVIEFVIDIIGRMLGFLRL